MLPAAPLVTPFFRFPSDVQLNIYNYGEIKNSSNVMGVIRGSVEPGKAQVAHPNLSSIPPVFHPQTGT